MKWTSELYSLHLDWRGYERLLHEYLMSQIKEAAHKYLDTVLRIIPTWSRASRATFEELANAVDYNVTYGPVKANTDRLLLGMSAGRGGLQIVKGQSYYFYYATSLKYLIYNEMNRATPGPPPQPFGRLLNPTPYNFRAAGEAEFTSFAQNIMLPSPLGDITKKRI